MRKSKEFLEFLSVMNDYEQGQIELIGAMLHLKASLDVYQKQSEDALKKVQAISKLLINSND